MLEVHARIHAWKQEVLQREGRQRHVDLRPERNAITQIARQIGQEATVLCFDEFQVTDVADAIIMSRLFAELWQGSGVVVVATSNRPPEDLYLGGLNRAYFLPFIDLLRRQCRVESMESERDHRRGFAWQQGKYFTPTGLEGVSEEKRRVGEGENAGAGSKGGKEEGKKGRVAEAKETFKGRREAATALDAAFLRLSGGRRGGPCQVPVMMGRTLQVPEACGGICRFSFEELCATDVFAADYQALSGHFHTLVLEGVACMGARRANEARRFITLVDVLYESKTRLLMSAERPIENLFLGEERKEEGNTGSGGVVGGSGGQVGSGAGGGKRGTRREEENWKQGARKGQGGSMWMRLKS
ncbi:hypothetical protein NSK_007041 [Nannochloropsis salina CCMP1776]|uniref:Uncharacterized protein n=1 Tax=Nannochloropsis salina CCMP1776 TaxID=1027361 RepID=A0A4D9CTA1_9STRA|nr:hypothetical protein NSK_007041 [Nannochloropsis salina CCMP1776]|eukprot:TFJ81794.1 hypothetical protein NSK_007041 [Nannochloropsis salina CCMP1776]